MFVEVKEQSYNISLALAVILFGGDKYMQVDKPESKGSILVIDDEKITLRNLMHILKKSGYVTTGTQSGKKALRLIDEKEFDIVITDLKMPKVDGQTILKRVKERYPETEVIMITGYASVESAIECMKSGAYTYIVKPFKIDEVRKIISQAISKRRISLDNRAFRRHREKNPDIKIIAEDPAMKRILEVARQVAASSCSVLITGESGTGKEVLARYIHEMSARRDGPLVAVNCGVFAEELLSNELFGHEKGAYTGADSVKKGLIEEANGGTLFLDEITEITLQMQVKLLRVIQEREIMRVGGTKPTKIDVRFLFATNRNIEKLVEEEKFRHDLYYRINVVNIKLPPLSERKKDISLLVHFFIEKYSKEAGKNVCSITPEAMEMLKRYDYPGNVRELENIIERAVVLTKGDTIDVDNLPDLHVATFRPKRGELPSLEEQERNYIKWVLDHTGWNRSRTADILNIDRVSLWRKIKRYGLERCR